MRIKLTGLFVSMTLALTGQTNNELPQTNNSAAESSYEVSTDSNQDYYQRLLEYKDTSSSGSSSEIYSPKKSSVVTCSDSVYIERLTSLPTKMELSFNPKVRGYIERYAKRGKSHVSHMLGEGKYYFPLFEEILVREGLPLELKYLTIIESALNPTARSKAGATGLWQFMDKTGKNFNLQINGLVDERRDPVKSTYAAAKFLKELYDTYGDWNLVLAAYNCGAGNVNKAIQRSGGKTDFWEIQSYLPKETREYVPAFIAAVYIMNYHHEHNIHPAKCPYPSSMDSIKINKRMHFREIAEKVNLSVADLRKFNPQFKGDIIPGNVKEYTLNLPTQNVLAYIDSENKKSGASLPDINMEKVGNDILSNPLLADANTKNNQGSFLDELSKVGKPSSPVAQEYVTVQKAQTIISYHEIGKGETLYRVAKANKVTVEELRRWNDLESNSVKMGMKLKIMRVEFISVEEAIKTQYKEPALLAIAPSSDITLDIMGGYLKKTNIAIEQEREFDNATNSYNMKMLAIANEIDYRNNDFGRKKNIWGRITNTATLAFNSVKNWGESATEAISKNIKAKAVRKNLDTDTDVTKQELLAEVPKETVTEVKQTNLFAIKNGLSAVPEREAILTAADIAAKDENLVKLYHKVRIGETVTQIATRYKVSKDDIVAWNNLDTGMAKVRQRLLIFIPKDKRLATNKIDLLDNI